MEYRNPVPTVDAILTRTTADRQQEILLIKRRDDPYKDCWALPGGFVNEAKAKRSLVWALVWSVAAATGSLVSVVLAVAERNPSALFGWAMAGLWASAEAVRAAARLEATDDR